MPDAERQKGQRPEMPDAECQKCQMLNARKAKCQRPEMPNAQCRTANPVILGIRHSRRAFPGGTNLMLLDN
jgi:hypothetical protein